MVGARKFLVAYNVFLNTTNVEIAKKVGKAVRFSNGGLRFVKGMGVKVRGLAGLDEPDRHGSNSDRAGVRIRKARSRPLWRDAVIK